MYYICSQSVKEKNENFFGVGELTFHRGGSFLTMAEEATVAGIPMARVAGIRGGNSV